MDSARRAEGQSQAGSLFICQEREQLNTSL